MITVGLVYMYIPDAPVREVMMYMVGMGRGVLNPMRGRILRQYPIGQTRPGYPPSIGTESGTFSLFAPDRMHATDTRP